MRPRSRSRPFLGGLVHGGLLFVMLGGLKKRRADTGPRVRFSAAQFAAVTGLVCGLAAAGVAGAADVVRETYGPPASRTPLADTGLWEPPVLNSTEDSRYLDIPDDEGLAAFYGAYKPTFKEDQILFEVISLSEYDVHYFGSADGYRAGEYRLPTHDYIVQYKVLHQAKNYVLVKYREFPYKNTLTVSDRPFFDHDYIKSVGFGVLIFEKKTYYEKGFAFNFIRCESEWSYLFEPDNYDQTPEQDAEDFNNSQEGGKMRENFPKGKLSCGRGPASYEPERLWRD